MNWTVTNPFAKSLLQTPSGDGTVPADSARCPNIPAPKIRSTRNVTGVEHAAVYGHAGFNALVMTAIRTILSE